MHAGEDHVHGGSHPCTFARAWTLVAAANGAGGSEVPDGAMEAHENFPAKVFDKSSANPWKMQGQCNEII